MSKPLIQERVWLMGEGRIPREEIERHSDGHMKIFLREPDPRKWPPEMASLEEYLPKAERFKWRAFTVAERYESILDEALRRWFWSSWTDLQEDPMVAGKEGASLILETLSEYLRKRIESLMNSSDCSPGE